MPSASPPPSRPLGDKIAIDGAYQYRALHEGNPVQRCWHEAKLWLVDRFLPPRAGDFVLDVGCGSGVVADHLARGGATVLGVDANRAAVEFARQRFARETLSFYQGFVDDAFAVDQEAAAVYCIEVLEHMQYDQALALLRRFHALLAEGGRALLTTPNYWSAWPLIELACDVFMSTAAMREEQHVCRFNPRKLRRICEQAGFEVERAGSFCLAAPWLAPVSRRLARRVHDAEVLLPCPAGALLFIVLRKR